MDERYPNTTGRQWSPTATPGDRSMTDQAREVAQSARQGLEQAGEYINETVSKTQEMVQRYTDGGVDRVKEDVVEYTRKQPMTALLIATGAGLLLGMLMAVGNRR